MEQFNPSTYKKDGAAKEFTHSCLGKIIILCAIAIILMIIAAITRPSDSMMVWQTEDNIHECLQASDSIESDAIDDYVGNIGRIITHADTTKTNPEMWETYKRLNRLNIYPHTLFKTARITNNTHPEGVRVGVGIFGIVIPILNYDDFLMAEGNIRGKHHDRIIGDGTVPEMDYGNNPMLKPYHYKGNPDD